MLPNLFAYEYKFIKMNFGAEKTLGPASVGRAPRRPRPPLGSMPSRQPGSEWRPVASAAVSKRARSLGRLSALGFRLLAGQQTPSLQMDRRPNGSV